MVDYVQELWEIYVKVKASGKYNFQECRLQLPSKFNFDFIEQELVDYEDSKIVDMLKFGFPVDCTLKKFNPGIPSNHKGAMEYIDEVKKLVLKEVHLGGFLGPFTTPPFRNPWFSPLNSVPKKDSQERRLILDLSFPPGSSINDGIEKDWYLGEYSKLSLPSLHRLVDKVVSLGRHCKLFKVDLSRGYKQMFIDPIDFEKMGFTCENMFFFDCTLSMGSRSSARCCQHITSTVVYVFTKWGYFAINYLDDLGGAEDEEHADLAFATLRKLLVQFRLSEALNKSCPPNHVMVFLGIEVNSILLIMRIPGEKMSEILELLQFWTNKTHCSVRELQSLAGPLNFASRCVKSGRIYLSRILNFLRTMNNVGTYRIPRDTQLDILWWKEFFPLYNGVSLMMNSEWTEADQLIASDSCLTGGGAYTNNQFVHFQFPEIVLKKCKHINQLECVTLVVAIAKWAPLFRCSKLLVNCDNQVTVQCINSGFSRNKVLQSCLRYLHRVMALESFDLKAQYLTSGDNRVADSLSCWHLGQRYRKEFIEYSRTRNMKEVHITDSEFQFLFS